MKLWQMYYEGQPIGTPMTEGKAIKQYKAMCYCLKNIDLRMITEVSA
jgi:hypothetical protein